MRVSRHDHLSELVALDARVAVALVEREALADLVRVRG